jgi:dipeptidyl aminopeptidase/acylaminoacyl peptidase
MTSFSSEPKNLENAIEIISRGQTMRGFLHRPHNFSAAQRVPAVLIFHGFTGNSIESHRLFVKTARVLAASEMCVLRFDFVGSGNSDGDFENATIESEIDDALTAISWLGTQAGVDRTRLALVGLSLGGLVATCAAARSQQIKSLVLWAATAGFAQRREYWEADLSRRFLPQQNAYDFGGNLVGRAFADDATKTLPLQEAAKFTGNALILHGDNDATVDVSDAREYSQALKNSRLHIITGADHTFNSFAWESELLHETAAFLRENL